MSPAVSRRERVAGQHGRVAVMSVAVLAGLLLLQPVPAAAQTVVTLDLTESGAGTVTSSPAGLSCSGTAQTCTGTFAPNTAVTLTATPSAGQTFGGWSGACQGTGPCSFVTATGLLLAATFQGPPAYVFYHQDVIGSVRAVTNDAGAEIARYDYEPFGEAQSAPGGPIRFGGKELDEETQFYYFGARFQRNILGRFTTVDPVLEQQPAMLDPQRWNRFSFARNSPLVFVDPTGAAIELIGGASDRDAALALLQSGVGDAGEFLYINELDVDGIRRYFVGIRGNVGRFMGFNEAAHNLANLIGHPSIVEFQVTSRDLGRFGGAVTYEPGEAGNMNTRVMVNAGQVGLALNPNTVIGRSRFGADVPVSAIRPLTAEIAAWHEFGHAWGFVNGRTMRQTTVEAIGWENLMRGMVYGPFGPRNAPRILH